MTRDLVKKKKTNPPLRSKWMYSQDRKKKLRMDGSIWRTAHWVEIKYQKERENGNSLAFFAEMFFLHYKVGKKKKKRERERSATFLYSNTAGWIVKVNWSENPLSFCCAAPGLQKESRGNPGDGRTTTTMTVAGEAKLSECVCSIIFWSCRGDDRESDRGRER
jgi:hypothetical protein